MKKIIDNLPLFSICFLYFGFCNLYYYYLPFNIDIYSYVTNSEILLSFFPVIVVSSSILYGYFYQLVIRASRKEEKIEPSIDATAPPHKSSKSRTNQILSDGPAILFYYILITVLITFCLQKFFNLKTYDLQWLQIIFAGLFFLLFYYLIRRRNNVEVIEKNYFIFSLFVLIYIGNLINSHRRADAARIIDGIPIRNVVLKYNNSIFRTGKDILYFGQTQSSIFFYNRKDSSSLVLQMSRVDSLVIK